MNLKQKMMFTVCLKTSSGSGIFIGGCWFNDPMMSRDWPLVTNSNWLSCWVTLTLVLESSITTDTLLMFCIVSMATSYSLSDRMLPKQIINKKRGRHSTDRKTKQPKQKGARHGQLNQNKDIPRWERVRPSRSKMDPFCWPADDLNCLGCYSSAASRLAKGWQRARKLFFFFNGYEGNNQRENDSQRGFNEARVCVCGVVIRSK